MPVKKFETEPMNFKYTLGLVIGQLDVFLNMIIIVSA